MPDVEIDSETDGVRTDDSVVVVRAEGLQGGQASWFLAPGEEIEILDDGPNCVSVEVLEDG